MRLKALVTAEVEVEVLKNTVKDIDFDRAEKLIEELKR